MQSKSGLDFKFMMEWRQYRVMLYQAVTEHHCTNSLAPRGYSSNFIRVICKHMLWIKFMSASCEFVLSWIPPNTVDEKSTLVLIMTLCHQATGHLSQYSPDKCCIFFRTIEKRENTFSPWWIFGFHVSSLIHLRMILHGAQFRQN